MKTGRDVLDQQYLVMRERVLSLAADFDRIQRAEGGPAVLQSDARSRALAECLGLLVANAPDRAAAVQMILSDTTPPPER
ncbi:MAG TPA: hypothetical protein VGB55_04435 [Tepidisphaeraceae bacterium]|jgi:hypothetical protein